MKYGDQPAFPALYKDGIGLTVMPENGMTLRDYFASKAIQTVLQSNAPWPLPDDLSEWAKKSYQIADAMLEARKR